MDGIEELGVLKDRSLMNGRWSLQCVDRNGRPKWSEEFDNLLTNQGLNHFLDTVFHGTTQITTWYIGLIRDDNYGAGPAAGDTLASHAGWEEGTEYAGNRKEWTEGAASSQSMTNAVTVDFAINATQVMKGAFLASVNTGGSGSDILMSAGLFSQGDRSVADGDTVKVTYAISASDQ